MPSSSSTQQTLNAFFKRKVLEDSNDDEVPKVARVESTAPVVGVAQDQPGARATVDFDAAVQRATESGSEVVLTTTTTTTTTATIKPPVREANAFDALRQSDNPMTWAALYEWRLDKIDPEHVLFDKTYVGQLCRAGKTPEEAFAERTYQHKNDSVTNPKEVGLHAAIGIFGVDAFTVQLIPGERKHAPRTEAMEWANQREIALIAERGGVLRDMNEKLQQTLNLTVGGTMGEAASMWQGIQAMSAKKWRDFQVAAQCYFEREGNLVVPFSHVEGTYRLGGVANGIKCNGNFVTNHPERMAWLQERGWVNNMAEKLWCDFQRAAQSYYDREGHLRVPQTHWENGYRLGQNLSDVRHSGQYITDRPDREAWLRARGHVDSELEARWLDFKEALTAFFNREGHVDVPQDHDEGTYKLGKGVAHVRRIACFIKSHTDRALWLFSLGFKMYCSDPAENMRRWEKLVPPGMLPATPSAPPVAPPLRRATWHDIQVLAQAYFDREGHLRVPKSHIESDYKLGNSMDGIRSQFTFVKGHPDRALWLFQRGFVMYASDHDENTRRWEKVLPPGTLPVTPPAPPVAPRSSAYDYYADSSDCDDDGPA
jgi:hypothetical protein